MVNFIAGSMKFIGKYVFQIVLVVLIFALIMVYMVVHNVHFTKSRPQLQKVVVVEGMTSNTPLAMHFCKQNMTEPDGGQKNCNKLGRNACNLTECCGWAVYKEESKKKNDKLKDQCVAVNITAGQPLGMTHRTNAEDVDTLYFQKKKINI